MPVKCKKCTTTRISVRVKEIEVVEIDSKTSNMARLIAHSVAL